MVSQCVGETALWWRHGAPSHGDWCAWFPSRRATGDLLIRGDGAFTSASLTGSTGIILAPDYFLIYVFGYILWKLGSETAKKSDCYLKIEAGVKLSVVTAIF